MYIQNTGKYSRRPHLQKKTVGHKDWLAIDMLNEYIIIYIFTLKLNIGLIWSCLKAPPPLVSVGQVSIIWGCRSRTPEKRLSCSSSNMHMQECRPARQRTDPGLHQFTWLTLRVNHTERQLAGSGGGLTTTNVTSVATMRRQDSGVGWNNGNNVYRVPRLKIAR